MARPRVAIVHHWLVMMRGGERLLEHLLRMFPEAEIFTHVYVPDAVSARIRAHRVHTTFINRLPGAARHYQKYLPLMPYALEQLDLRGFDIVISIESGPSKGVIAPPDAFHLCYCNSPMRYLYDHYPDYHATAGRLARLMMPATFNRLRMWDYVSAQRVDRVAANSSFIQRRIRRAWNRDSTVVFPPVETGLFARSATVGDTYLWVGQVTPYKRADLAVDAFNELGLPLLMVGDGDLLPELRRRARPNIRFKDRLGFDELRAAYASARALVFTAEEDFGIVPVEAMASGRPVLAYGSGGACDTVVPGETGLLFAEQTSESLVAGVRALERWLPDFDPERAIAQAGNFSPAHFEQGIRALLP